MSQHTKIEWADATFNPWIGCTKVSPGCDNCYAEALDKRLWGGTRWGPGAPRLRTKTWDQPRRWNARQAKHEAACIERGIAPTPRPRVFCASLADVFDHEVHDDVRRELFRLIDATPHLIWMLLTKRPHLISGIPPKRPHVWLGTTIENQLYVPRLDHLTRIPAVQYFLSVEPMLGPVRLPEPLPPNLWVICGGESGPNARPFDPDWARALRDQCADAGDAAFFMKQMGSRPVGLTLRDKKGGDPNEWPEDLRLRHLPKRSFELA